MHVTEIRLNLSSIDIHVIEIRLNLFIQIHNTEFIVLLLRMST
jgi:hypothetical protein